MPDRAVSETMAVALLIAIVITGTTVVVLLGSGGLDDLQSQTQTERAEISMTQFASDAALVAHGMSSVQDVRINTRSNGALYADGNKGQVYVTSTAEGGNKTVILNRSIGEVRYEQGDSIIAYQMGGVWRKSLSSNSSLMVSPPEFHYRGTTLTLPIITVNGQSNSSGAPKTITATGREEISGYTNPISEGTINITIQSPYYEAWGKYFEQRTEGKVYYEHPTQNVTVELVNSHSAPRAVSGAITSGASGETIDLDNNVIVNAYNSSADESPTPNGVSSNHQGGTIRVAGDLKLNSGNVRIVSNVTAGGDVVLGDSSTKIRRSDVFCTQGNHGCVEGSDNIEEGEEINSSRTIDIPSSKSGLVKEKLDTIGNRNDNDQTGKISGNRLEWSAKDNKDQLTLDNGTYYLNKIEMTNTGNQVLVLDTSNGDIELAVDGNFHLDGTDILVRGDSGAVRVYADVSDEHSHGGDSGDLDFTGGHVKVQESQGDGNGNWKDSYDSTRFWLYAPAGIEADLDRGSRDTYFTGVIFAPDESGAEGDISIESSTVNGAIVGHIDQADEGDKQSRISFDEALLEKGVVGESSAPSKTEVSYLHINVYNIEVDD